MQVPLHCHFHGMETSPAIDTLIRDHIDRLHRSFARITAAHVTVDKRSRRRSQGDQYQVKVVLTVPGRDIVINRTGPKDALHEDFRAALRDAFDAARRKLEDHSRTARGQVKAHSEPNQGRVLRMLNDHGFAEDAMGIEIYFHRNAVVGDAFEQLEPGDKVRIVIAEGEGEKGPQASSIVPLAKRRGAR